MKISNVFMAILKGILAGLAIAFGGLLFILSTTYIKGDTGKAVGALLFPFGLLTVCAFSLFLFTGKIGLIFEEKQSKEFYISLPLMFLGNLIGAVGFGYLTYFILKDTPIYVRACEVASSKMVFENFGNYLACFLKSAFCGLCVYLAVKAYAYSASKAKGIFLLFAFIFLFVFSGFEHCVANVFYFSAANAWGIVYSLINLGLCVLGNIVGTIPGVLLLKVIKEK